MAILTLGDFPAVRAALDVTLGPRALPDETISLDIYQGAAERWVKREDPDWSTYDQEGDAAASIRAAAIYMTASLLAPALPVITGETYGQRYRYTRERIDLAALAAELAARASQAIKDARDEDPSTDAPAGPRPFFAVACGRRGA